VSARRDGAPRWPRSWRILVSALAGGGLTIAGLGGPLAGGAFGSEAGTGTTGPGGEPSTSTTPEAGTSTTTTTTTTTPTTPTPTVTTTAETTTTGATTTPSSTGTATTPAPASAPPGTSDQGPSEAPSVVVRRKQRSTPSKPSSPNVTTTEAGATGVGAGQGKQSPSGAEANASNNVAPPPQLVAEQASALAALLDGSGVASAQALNFYRIPLFLLPIYQAAAARYDVPWPILAAINEIETDYGMDLSVSSAGAEGWMQFEPGTWLQYGVDALNAGYADPYNPVDAIFAAARYLNAAGAAHNLSASIMAYNHSEAYVESVLLRAKLIAAYPGQVIATLTGMIDGRPPVTGKRIAWGAPVALPGGAPRAAGAAPRSGAGAAADQPPNASSATAGASPLRPSASMTGSVAAQGSTATPGSTAAPAPGAAASASTAPVAQTQGVDLTSAPNARVVAVQDGRVIKLGYSRKLGKYVVLQDIYGDVFTYAGLGGLAHSYALPKSDALLGDATQSEGAAHGSASLSGPSHTGAGKVRVFAHPGAGNQDARAAAASARASTRADGRQPLRAGSVVAQGTVLGHVGHPPNARDGHLLFAIRPAGDSGTIDPRAILENWVQLDAALHPQGAKGNPSLLGATATDVLLLSKSQLERTVLADPGIALSACSRHEVASGAIDKRALAVLAFLSRSGLKPTVGTLRCGAYDAAGYVQSGHAGDAVAIVAINGTPIAGHQGAGSITDTTIRTLLTLQNEYAPARIVSLMRYPGAPSTLARADHGDYLEIVFPRALGLAARRASAKSAAAGQAPGAAGTTSATTAIAGELSSSQWEQLIGRVAALPAPSVAYKPSSAAIPDHPRAASK
jgi:membrane-bound lytic murein transglycosylase B